MPIKLNFNNSNIKDNQLPFLLYTIGTNDSNLMAEVIVTKNRENLLMPHGETLAYIIKNGVPTNIHLVYQNKSDQNPKFVKPYIKSADQKVKSLFDKEIFLSLPNKKIHNPRTIEEKIQSVTFKYLTNYGAK